MGGVGGVGGVGSNALPSSSPSLIWLQLGFGLAGAVTKLQLYCSRVKYGCPLGQCDNNASNKHCYLFGITTICEFCYLTVNSGRTMRLTFSFRQI